MNKKKMIHLGTGLLILLLSVALAMPAMAGKKVTPAEPWLNFDYYEKEKPVRGGYYRNAYPLDPGFLQPNHWPVNDWVVITRFFEKLIATDGQYKAAPWLIKSWEYPDATSCITELKTGITYSDGVKLTAETVKFNIDWVRDASNGCWSRSWFDSIVKVEVIDEYTLRWHFNKPWAAFLGTLANAPGYMISPEALKKGGVWTRTHPVGTGPYMLEELSSGNYTKMKRNPNWWFGKKYGHPDMPYYDGMIQYVIPDPSVMLANLKAGKIEAMLGMNPSQYDELQGHPAITTYERPLNWLTALRFNTTKGPCKDIRVRKAISHALDYKAMIAGINFGHARLAAGPFPDDHWAHNPELKPVSYDPELAKKLLAEAGYKKGLTIRGYMYTDPLSSTRLVVVKSMLKKIGVDWKVDSLSPTAASARMYDADYDLATGGWQWIYDPDMLVTGLFHPDGGFNFGRSNNPAIIELIEQGRSELDADKRLKLYHKLEKMIYDDYQSVWVNHPMTILAMRNSVRGYERANYKKYKEAWYMSHPGWFKEGKTPD